MNERSYQKAVVQGLRKTGHIVQVFNDKGTIGIPDFLVSEHRGKKVDPFVSFIEVKLVRLPKQDDTLIRPGVSGPQVNWCRVWDKSAIPVRFLFGLVDTDKHGRHKYLGYLVLPATDIVDGVHERITRNDAIVAAVTGKPTNTLHFEPMEVGRRSNMIQSPSIERLRNTNI